VLSLRDGGQDLSGSWIETHQTITCKFCKVAWHEATIVRGDLESQCEERKKTTDDASLNGDATGAPSGPCPAPESAVTSEHWVNRNSTAFTGHACNVNSNYSLGTHDSMEAGAALPAGATDFPNHGTLALQA
jgi:hypothetical protein